MNSNTKESLNKKLKYYKRRLYRQKKKLEKLDMFKNSDSNFIQYRSRQICQEKNTIKYDIEDIENMITHYKKELSEIK